MIFSENSFEILRRKLGGNYPEVLLIMGNDDPRYFEQSLIDGGRDGLWTYIHNRRIQFGSFDIFGYNYVPPTPFMMKDWERYDVSRYTDIGCVSPEEGRRSVAVDQHEQKWTTIKDDLEQLTEGRELGSSVFLFHAPPYGTNLDVGDLGGRVIDHVPVDEHLGSIAVARFIEERQPMLTLHGHVHESARLSGEWIQKIGKTVCINGASEGDELVLCRIPLENPENTERLIIS